MSDVFFILKLPNLQNAKILQKQLMLQKYWNSE